MIKMYYTLVIILCLEGCIIPFFGDNEIPMEKELIVNMVVKDLEEITDFMKRHNEEDVKFDLILFTAKDEYYNTFGILTLETKTEIDMYFVYSIEYLTSIMAVMSFELDEKDYDWSWNQVLIDMKRQVQYELNHRRENPTEKN